MAVALVTGGGRGIGRAIALKLAGEGHDVAVNYASRRDPAEEVARLIRGQGRNAVAIEADLGEAEKAGELVDRTESELGPIAILISNAGIVSEPTGVAAITTRPGSGCWRSTCALRSCWGAGWRLRWPRRVSGGSSSSRRSPRTPAD